MAYVAADVAGIGRGEQMLYAGNDASDSLLLVQQKWATRNLSGVQRWFHDNFAVVISTHHKSVGDIVLEAGATT